MNPVLQEVAGKMGDKARIIKVDVDRNQNAAMAYQIRGVPTYIIFKNGKQLWRQSGVVPREVLINQLNTAISA